MGRTIRAMAIPFAAVAIGAAWFARASTQGQRTVNEVIEKYGARVRTEYEARCKSKGIPWPPERLRLLAFKEERVLEVWAAGAAGGYRNLESIPILGASGGPGPKRREGDCQVPEGDYGLTGLNPNSRFHLSIRVDYPSADDVARSTIPAREMGGDIFIHGGRASIGCIAVGDNRIEELFCLAALVKDRRILIAPADLRRRSVSAEDPAVNALYERLALRLAEFR